MEEKPKTIVDWDEEQKRIEAEYKRKLAELKKRKQDNAMVNKILTRGILPTLVLNIISVQPCNGNELSCKISDITSGFWQPSTGGIYPILKRFEKQGLVSGKWNDPDKRVKKIYTITQKGSEELGNQRESLINNLYETVGVLESIIKTLK
jgi:DNA-binding PadR family transcriptional regulator